MKKQSFMKGAVILMIANAVAKILGAIFKIPLTYILGEEGMAVFNTAFSVYTTVLSFIISGMPLALTKLISEEYAKNHFASVKKAMNVSLILLSGLGILGTIIIYLFSPQLALSMNDASASSAIRVISPAVFFVAVGVVYKSYYQGVQYMTPIGVSQVAEAFIKLAAGYILALYMSRFSIQLAAAGAVGGIAVGEIIATAVLMIMCAKPENTNNEKTIPTRKILYRIFLVAAPVIIASAIGGAFSFLDVAMVRTRLCEISFDTQSASAFLTEYGVHTSLFNTLMTDLKINADGARWLYGAYSGYALTIFHLPTGIIGALCMGVFPAISAAAATKNTSHIQSLSENALRMTIILSLPCAAVMYLFPEEILLALFSNCASAPMLRTLAPCTVAVCVTQICSTILQGTGKIKLPLVYGLASAGLKPVIGWFLIAVPSLNIRGAAISAVICCSCEMLCSLLMCRKYANMRTNTVSCVVKPLIAAICMGGVMLMCYPYMRTLLVRDLYALAGAGIIGAAVYFGILAISGELNKKKLLNRANG